jgi:hypothetical protein
VLYPAREITTDAEKAFPHGGFPGEWDDDAARIALAQINTTVGTS